MSGIEVDGDGTPSWAQEVPGDASAPEGSLGQLKLALKGAMSETGALDRLRARVRGEVFELLEGGGAGNSALQPPISSSNLLINELIRDYLRFNGLDHSLSVFLAESGQPREGELDRSFLRGELGLVESTVGASRPLLYGIVHMLKERRRQGGIQAETDVPGELAPKRQGTAYEGSSIVQAMKEPDPILFLNK